ncbi:MAG: hypothetical protein U0166_25160 [Acidobacteriota bacterium]
MLAALACRPRPTLAPETAARAGDRTAEAARGESAFPEASKARIDERLGDALDLYEAARRHDMASYEAAWRASRACIELLDSVWDERTRDQRVELAQRGINHALAAVAAEPQRPDGHYYLAIANGLLGKAKGLGGKKVIDPIIESCKRVIAIDPAYAGGGAHRVLGALYQKAPAWPTSVGDLDLSRQELEAACAIAPDEAENHLFLAHTLADLDDKDSARLELARFHELAAGRKPPRFWGEEEAEIQKKLGSGAQP